MRTAELIQDNQSASKALMAHLQQILPSIAFYEALLAKERSQKKALELYKKIPVLMKSLLDKTFGHAAGFYYIEKELENGFAADMTVCPYVETCIPSLSGDEPKLWVPAGNAVILVYG